MSSCNFACKSIAKAVDLELTQYIMKAEFENAKIDFRYLLIDEVTNSEMVTSPPKKGVMDLFAVNRDDDLASLRRLGVMIHAEIDGPEPVGDSYVVHRSSSWVKVPSYLTCADGHVTLLSRRHSKKLRPQLLVRPAYF